MIKKPLLSYLSEVELDILLNESFKTLETTGTYIPNKRAKDILKSAGAIEKDNDILTLPSELVKEVLGNVSPRFKLYDQKGQGFLNMEIGNTFYGPGSDLQYVIDMETEKPRLTKLHDIAKHISMIDKIPEFDFLMSTGLPHDVTSDKLYEEVFRTMILNSDKPMVTTGANLDDIKKTYEIAKITAGSAQSFRDRPFYVAYLEPVSPLKTESDIAEKVMFCAEKGVPYLFAAGANIAVQAPGSPEGAVIQGTAESLSGLVLGYLVNNDVKFVFGSNSAGFDGVKGIVSYGGPEWSKTMALYAELGRRLNLPVWGAAGCSDANKLDAQAGLEAAQSVLMAELCGSTLVHNVGYLSHGDMTDPRAYIFNSEIIKRAKWSRERGIIVPGEIPPVIDDVVSGRIKTYLDSDHTLQKFGTRYHPSKWIDRNLHIESKDLLESLKQETNGLLEKCNPVTGIEVTSKRTDGPEEYNGPIEIKEIEKKDSLESIFKDNPTGADKVKDYLQAQLDAEKNPDELYLDLAKVLEKTIDGANLVFQLAYGRLFNDTADIVLEKMEYSKEGTPLVLATVEGDIHYVGKNLVGQLAAVSGYNIVDNGMDAKTGELILSALDNGANLMGLSALLTTTRDNMHKTIDAMRSLSIKDQVGVIIGGAVIDKDYAKEIGADAYRRNAGEAASALDGIKQDFIDTYKRKNIIDDNFSVIGENINSISTKVKEAMKNKDEETILEIARKQIDNGAIYLDVAVSHLGDITLQEDAMKWAVMTLQENFDVPLCIDSDDYRVIEAGVSVYDSTKVGSAIINSATLDKDRLENMTRIAKESGSYIVFQAADGATIDEKLKITDQFIDYAASNGIAKDKIFVDPGLETMAHNQDSAKTALQTISALKDKHPELHYTVGLTNMGYGLGKMKHTRALQQSFLKIAKRVGMDSAITSPNVLNYKFNDRTKALSESIEFIAGIRDNVDYAQRILDTEYESN